MNEQPEYQKVGGLGSYFMQPNQVWIADDHILHLSSSLVNQFYTRFYFRDIQGLVVQKLARSWLRAAYWIAAGLIVGALALTQLPEAQVTAGLGLALTFIAFASYVLLRSRNCRLYIKTAVRTEPLPAIRDLKQSEHFLETIRPRIEAAQPPEEANHEQPRKTEMP